MKVYILIQFKNLVLVSSGYLTYRKSVKYHQNGLLFVTTNIWLYKPNDNDLYHITVAKMLNTVKI